MRLQCSFFFITVLLTVVPLRCSFVAAITTEEPELRLHGDVPEEEYALAENCGEKFTWCPIVQVKKIRSDQITDDSDEKNVCNKEDAASNANESQYSRSNTCGMYENLGQMRYICGAFFIVICGLLLRIIRKRPPATHDALVGDDRGPGKGCEVSNDHIRHTGELRIFYFDATSGRALGAVIFRND
jgi:hypothetical protein